jgi:hypothetical protein
MHDGAHVTLVEPLGREVLCQRNDIVFLGTRPVLAIWMCEQGRAVVEDAKLLYNAFSER